MNSHNHPMFGSIGAWLFRELAGIAIADGGEGYAEVRIRPGAVRDLRYCSGSFDTIRGPAASSWQRQTDGFLLDAVIPVGSDAEIEIPKLQLREVVLSEGGAVLWKDGAAQSLVPGIRAVRETPAAIVVVCGGGHYRFGLKGR